MAGQASVDAETPELTPNPPNSIWSGFPVVNPKGAGPSDNSTSLTASAQGSTEQETARQPSLPISNFPLKPPGKGTSSNAGDSSVPNSHNILQDQNGSQKPPDLIEQESARQPSFSTSTTSVKAPSIISSENEQTFPTSDSVNVENEESQRLQELQNTARQPSLSVPPTSSRIGSIHSAGNEDASAATDSYNTSASLNEETQIPRNLLNQKTPSQSSLLFSPPQLEAAAVDSSGGANVSSTAEINSVTADTVKEPQKPQELEISRTPSQYSLPLSSLSETERVKWLNNADSRVDTEIPGSWPDTSEASPTAQDLQELETPRHPFLPLSHISSEIDGVKPPGNSDAPVAAEPPNISKSPSLSLFSSSSSSSLSKSSDQETMRALERGTEETANVTPSFVAALNEEVTPPNNVESRVLASPSARESQDTLDVEKPSLPTTAAVLSPSEETESSRAAVDPAPLTPAGLSKNADVPLLLRESEFPKEAGMPSLSKEQELSRTAKTLTPLKTTGFQNNADFPSQSKTAGSPRTANTPFSLNGFGPSNKAEKRYSLKNVDSPRTRSIIPASLQTAESPRSRDKRSKSNAVEFPNNVEVSSPLKRPGSSRIPPVLAEPNKRRSTNGAAASLEASLDLAPFPGTPLQETDTTKEQPEPEAPVVSVELPRSPAEGEKLPVPRIFIEKASDVPDVDISWSPPRLPTIEEKRQEGKLRQALTGALSQGAASPRAHSAGLHSPVSPKIAENVEEPKTPKIKRRKLYLRKARNVAARKVILKVTLGRELANKTKPALRRLAHGEPCGISSEDHVQVRVRVRAS